MSFSAAGFRRRQDGRKSEAVCYFFCCCSSTGYHGLFDCVQVGTCLFCLQTGYSYRLLYAFVIKFEFFFEAVATEWCVLKK